MAGANVAMLLLNAYGLVCVPRRFRLSRDGIGRLVHALDALLQAHPEPDAAITLGGEIWLEAPPEPDATTGTD